MTGEALRVGYDDGVGIGTERPPQGVDLGGRRAATRRRVGLVGNEDHLACHLRAVVTTGLGLAHESVHDRAHVVDVKPGAVEGGVRRGGAQDLRDGLDAALGCGVGGLDHERGCAHADDHAVAAAVERRGRVFDFRVSRRGSRGQEPGPDPRQQDLGGHVVCGDDDHAARAPRADPVFGHGQGLGSGCASGVDLGVRPPRADQFGELGVPHGQAPENEPPVEFEGLLRQQLAQLGDPLVDFDGRRFALADLGSHCLQGEQLLPATTVDLIALDVIGEGVIAREGRGEDDAGRVTHRLRQTPAVGQAGADGGLLVAHHQGDTGVAQGVETGADC